MSEVILFNYEHLNISEKYIYEIIFEGLRDIQNEIIIDSNLDKDISLLYKLVLYDHPELFWISSSFSYKEKSDRLIIYPQYYFDINQIHKMNIRLNEMVKKIINKAVMSEDQYDMILYLHDYIVSHSEYDLKAKKNHDSNVMASTAYGCIVQNNAICSGYSKGFQLLLNRIGISCGYVSGRLYNGGNHAWNYVYLGKKYFYVDVTFDDPLQLGNKSKGTKHNWFFVTTKEIEKNRSIANEGFVPECSIDSYSFYKQKDLYFDRFDIDEIKDSISLLASKERFIELKFSNEDVFREAYNSLIIQKNWNQIIQSKRITYSKDEDLFIIGINF